MAEDTLRPEGYYRANLVDAVLTEPKSGGALQFIMRFSLETGEEVKVYLYTTDAAWPWTTKKLEAMGFNGNFDAPEFTKGQDVELQCRQDSWEGKTREKWDIAGGVTAAPPDKARQLAARYRSTVTVPPTRPAGRPATPPAPPPPAPKPPAPPAPPAPQPSLSAAVTTKEEAWAHWVALAPDGQPDVKAWNAEIDRRGDEAQFTAREWSSIAAECLPF